MSRHSAFCLDDITVHQQQVGAFVCCDMMDFEQDKQMPSAGIKQDENDNNTNEKSEKIHRNDSLSISNSARSTNSKDSMDNPESASAPAINQLDVLAKTDTSGTECTEQCPVADTTANAVSTAEDESDQCETDEQAEVGEQQARGEDSGQVQDSSGIQVHIMEADDSSNEDRNSSDYICYKPTIGCGVDSSSFDRIPENLQRTPSPEELMVMEDIFEPRPSTSKDSGINRIGSPASGTSSTVSAGHEKELPSQESVQPPSSIDDKRQRLKFLPRTNQYEKHPLLQIRSESGLSEFEMMMLERDTTKQQAVAENPLRTYSLDESGQNKLKTTTQRLVPRGAHIERNALFEKTASGLSELEQYLLEKEQELGESSSTSQEVYRATTQNRHSISSVPLPLSTNSTSKMHSLSKAETLNSNNIQADNVKSSANAPKAKLKTSKSADARSKRPPMQHSKSISEGSLPSQQALQPRRIQYEKHHLLETRDDSGMSELDHFLKEKELEIKEKGKCSSKCTCKNVNCNKCKGASPRLTTKEVDMVTRIEPKMNNKRVHFQRQECVEAEHKTVPSTTNSGAEKDQSEQPADVLSAECVPREEGELHQTSAASHGQTATGKESQPVPGTLSDNPQAGDHGDGTRKEAKSNDKPSKTKTKRHKSVCTMS